MNKLESSPGNIKRLTLSGVKAILSTLPVASAFTTFVDEYINSNWQDRIEKTQTEILNRLSKLDEKFEERLRNNPNIASILATIYQSALSDIEEDKIALYVNSLVNAINNENIGNTKLHIFINYLKEISLMHIKILKYFKSNHSEESSIPLNSLGMPSREEVIARVIGQTEPSIVEDLDLLDSIIGDLNRKGLLRITKLAELHGNISKVIMKQTTPLGDEFINFFQNNEN